MENENKNVNENENVSLGEMIANTIAGIIFLVQFAWAIAVLAFCGFLGYVFLALAIATWPS